MTPPLAACVLAIAAAELGCTAAAPPIADDVPRSAAPFPDDPERFRFAIVGDRTGGHRPGVFREALEHVRRLQPDFVLCVGDLIEGYSEDREVLADEWDEIDAMVDDLGLPFFYTVGNHDFGNATMERVWHERLGRDYWSFVHRGVLFLSLNTEDPPIELPPDILARKARFERLMAEDPEKVERMLAERGQQGPPADLPSPIAISDEQVDWALRTLEQHADVRWTFVLMHKPAWAHDDPAFARIEAALRDRPYTVVAGHEHYYRHDVRRERDHIVMGTTGGVWISRGVGAFDHVAWVTMTGDGPEIALVRTDGLYDIGGPNEAP